MTNDFSAIIKSGLKRRHRQEKIFKNLGIISIMLALAFLVILFTAIISKGYSAFYYYQIAFELDLSKASPIAEENDYALLIKSALKTKFPEAQSVMQKADLFSLLSRQAAWEVRDQIAKNPALIGAKHYLWLTAASDS
jgi:phosphate transport system permease protein